jgi:mycothiol system anti-sigma-R factor
MSERPTVGRRNCEETAAKVYPFLDGEITWYRRARIRYHLRKCSNCTDAFVFEERLKMVVREKSQVEPPPEFVERLRDYLRDNLD